MSSLNEIKEILYNRITEFKNLLISYCDDEKNKNTIENIFKDIWFTKIMMFIILINSDKMNEQINEVIEKFKLLNNEEWQTKIKEFYPNFVSREHSIGNKNFLIFRE